MDLKYAQKQIRDSNKKLEQLRVQVKKLEQHNRKRVGYTLTDHHYCLAYVDMDDPLFFEDKQDAINYLKGKGYKYSKKYEEWYKGEGRIEDCADTIRIVELDKFKKQ